MERIRLLVGLGNPGTEYAYTRHNAGADFVERVAQHFNTPLQANKNYFGLYGKCMVDAEPLHLLIPSTFMNRSGKSVAALANFFKISATEILVAHDELDLPPGVARFKKSGGHGGHNGLRDIIAHLANVRDFYRLRIGIGHPGSAAQVSGFVLRRAPSSEQTLTNQAMDEALRHLPQALKGDWAQAMNHLHRFTAKE